ncbi:MAG: hypothetical protein M1423_02100 [Acidobacteria bacterium]|nr:hypothetical protein [Acidobacteriota bacterium]
MAGTIRIDEVIGGVDNQTASMITVAREKTSEPGQDRIRRLNNSLKILGLHYWRGK